MVGSLIQNKNGIMISVNVSVLIKYRACKENNAWNFSICTCECDKDCEIGVYLKELICTKNLVHDLIVTCYEIVGTTENTSINFNDKTSYWLFCVVLLAIACLLLLLIIAVGCYMKHVLTILSFWSYCYIMLGYDRIAVSESINITKTDGSHESIIPVRKNDYSINFLSMIKITAVYIMKNADLRK